MAAPALATAGSGCPPLPTPSSALPPELRPTLAAALRRFFAAPGLLALLAEAAGPGERADVLAAFLCGGVGGGSLAPAAPGTALPAPAAAAAAPPPTAPTPAAASRPAKRRRVLLTGCFDIMHAGHYNALRQAKAAFPGEEVELVAGVHSDEAIEEAKGAPTVLTHAERVELVAACRWVDEVVGDLPYAVPVRLLDQLRCDAAAHGDDLPAKPGGGGLLDEVMAAGRLRIVKRTEGTSTTALIGRLLSMSKEHLMSRTAAETLGSSRPRLVSKEVLGSWATPPVGVEAAAAAASSAAASAAGLASAAAAPAGAASSRLAGPASAELQAVAASGASALLQGTGTPMWMLLPTMSRMVLFFGDRDRARPLGAAGRVVYAPGEWDLFHVGHVRFLERARRLGDFLIVGCYDDDAIHRKKGKNYPLQTLHERALNVLACRHADDVLLAAPWRVTQDLLTTLNVAVVVTGSTNVFAASGTPSAGDVPAGLGDPFEEPRTAGLLQVIESDCFLTMDVLAERILRHAARYAARQARKQSPEQDSNQGKAFVAEA